MFKAVSYRINKYNARSVTVDGQRFASQAEALRYLELKLLEEAGVIRELRVHPRFVLLPAIKTPSGKRLRAICYTADFQYIEGDKVVVEDVKGAAARDFTLRINLFHRTYPELDFRIYWINGRKRG